MKKQKIFLAVTWGAILGSLALLVTRYIDSLARTGTAVADLIGSVVYYFQKIFLDRTPTVVPTVNTIPDIDLQKFIPFDLDELVRKWHALGDALWQEAFFNAYLEWLTLFLRECLVLLMLILPVLMMLGTVFQNVLMQEKTPRDHDKDTKAFAWFKRRIFPIFYTTREILWEYRDFLRDRAQLWKTFVFLWVMNLNLATIVIEFFAFYFYFAAAVEFGDLTTQLLKLLIDLIIMFAGAPFLFWLAVGCKIFDYVRRQIGYSVLSAHESENRAFLDSLPIVVMLVGSMGTGKTTMLVDLTLSQSLMFRDKAFEKMHVIQMRYPNFPWIRLEDDLRDEMKRNRKNLAMIRQYARLRGRSIALRGLRDPYVPYDIDAYRADYDDGLSVSGIADAVETYAQLYYIYLSSSLVVGNLSVRQDELLDSIGNFPVWECELFETPSVDPKEPGRHSYIIDFDMIRPGKRMVADNPNYGAFEYGVIDITEVGKERGNNLELRETKKNVEETNQKNDHMNQWLKMCRHAATVDHYPFIRVITDEQRPESWGADARDLCSIVHIMEKERLRLAMPGFLFEDMLHDLIAPKWQSFYTEYRYCRGDNTLTMFLLKLVVGGFLHHYERVYNTFGYCRLRVETERGTMDENREEHTYYIATKKAYAKRYATDCFSDYYAKMAMKAKRGLADLPQYKTECASFEELKKQNSYFIKSLLGDEEKEGGE